MFTKLKEGRQYSFSLELSSTELVDQNYNEMITFFDKSLHKEKDVKEISEPNSINIPVSVFREGNNGLRAIVLFLKEQKKLNFAQIAKILGRDQRTVWTAYSSAKKTRKKISKFDSNEPSINSSAFRERRFSILETAAINLLKEHTVRETAELLGRNQMTIWTVKRRAALKEKSEGGLDG